ncbi:hypothetical protein ACRAWD_13695 [Caulobacter segnis]
MRAVYNHARKTCRALPADNPTFGVDWNVERRRDTAMERQRSAALVHPKAGQLRHPIRREFHLFLLLSGSRPERPAGSQRRRVNFGKRLLRDSQSEGRAVEGFRHSPVAPDDAMPRPAPCAPAGGYTRREARTWIFAANSGVGHLVEHDGSARPCSSGATICGRAGRTLGQACGLSEIDMHLMMNHSIPGVNAGYITRAKLLGDHLLTAQRTCRGSLSRWAACAGVTRRRPSGPGHYLPSRKIGDPALDPTPPDPRVGRSYGGAPQRWREPSSADTKRARASARPWTTIGRSTSAAGCRPAGTVSHLLCWLWTPRFDTHGRHWPKGTRRGDRRKRLRRGGPQGPRSAPFPASRQLRPWACRSVAADVGLVDQESWPSRSPRQKL